jgi:hypothetical protein
LSIRYSERLADNDIVASVGSEGDSYDNATAESFNGLYKWELICPQGPWRGLDDIEFAMMTYVDWFNQRRLHGEITSDATYTIPAEAETDYYRQKKPADNTGRQGRHPTIRAVIKPGPIQPLSGVRTPQSHFVSSEPAGPSGWRYGSRSFAS